MATISISVVTTVLNEADTIHILLDSLQHQVSQPDELIIVDAGSTDQTLQLVADHGKTSKFPIQLIKAHQINRSRGRNIGISKARHDYIAVIDAGCEADSLWLLRLRQGFEEGYDAVAGFYLPSVDTTLERLFIPFVAVSPEKLNTHTYLPSSRSLAFTKQAWQAAGTYPEYLPTCEDLIFAERLKAVSSMVVKTNARVYWRMSHHLSGFFNQIAGYAYGDVLAGYKRHIYKIITVWARYGLFIVFPPLLLLYLIAKAWLHQHTIEKITCIPWFFIVTLIADLAVMWGSLKGWLQLLRGFQRIQYKK